MRLNQYIPTISVIAAIGITAVTFTFLYQLSVKEYQKTNPTAATPTTATILGVNEQNQQKSRNEVTVTVSGNLEFTPAGPLVVAPGTLITIVTDSRAFMTDTVWFTYTTGGEKQTIRILEKGKSFSFITPESGNATVNIMITGELGEEESVSTLKIITDK